MTGSPYTPNLTDINRPFALLAAGLWNLDRDSLQHIADFGNSVYLAHHAGQPLILRLTDPAVRSHADNQAELEYLQHLHKCGVQVNIPLPSRAGTVLEPIAIGDKTLLASLFTFAPGEVVDQTSPHWNEPFFREWGRALARIHAASRSFSPTGPACRWHWSEENLIAQADNYLPADDEASRREFKTLMTWSQTLPETEANFGLIHADFGPRNFHYHPDLGITAFDFGNCCYHWFFTDLAISLSTLRHFPRPERDQYRSWLLAGYQEIYPLDPDLLPHLSQFIRLRILYVYLDRLAFFSPTPTPPQQQILYQLRKNVHERFEW